MNLNKALVLACEALNDKAVSLQKKEYTDMAKCLTEARNRLMIEIKPNLRKLSPQVVA